MKISLKTVGFLILLTTLCCATKILADDDSDIEDCSIGDVIESILLLLNLIKSIGQFCSWLAIVGWQHALITSLVVTVLLVITAPLWLTACDEFGKKRWQPFRIGVLGLGLLKD